MRARPRAGAVVLCLAGSLSVGLVACGPAPPPPAPPPPPTPSPNAGVPPAILEIENGFAGAVADSYGVATPVPAPEFFARAADRAIRDRFFVDVPQIDRDAAAAPPAPPLSPEDLERAGIGLAGLRLVVAPDPPPAVTTNETRVTNPAFRAPILDGGAGVPPGLTASAMANRVRNHLGRDGLAVATVEAIAALPADDVLRMNPAALRVALQGAGLPVDLLDHFAPPVGAVASDAFAWLTELERDVSDGEARRAQAASGLRFVFRPTRADFAAMPDDGTVAPAAVRFQLTRGFYWGGPGAGGTLDVVRQVLGACPQLDAIASVEDQFLAELRVTVPSWPLGRPEQLSLIKQTTVVAQWTQDNAIAGTAPDTGRAFIVPRYATRGELPCVYVPGESFIADGLTAAGESVSHSPLLFEGGNILVYRANDGGRRALIGEAEIVRNRALGLRDDEVVAAFKAEFGLDDAMVVTPASFHIDYDVTVRRHDGALIAFVHDRLAGARIIVTSCLDALVAGGALTAETAAAARLELTAGDDRAALERVGRPVYGAAPGGRFPLSFVQTLRDGPRDEGVGNLVVLLAAMDVLHANVLGPDQGLDVPAAGAYYRALTRLLAVETRLAETLSAAGFEVVAVPGLAMGRRGIVPVNGLQLPDRYLQPANGGMLAPLDDAAARAFTDRLGPGVAIVPIRCAETMRRSGAVHCAVQFLPVAEG
jgi:hypothetical protein